MRVRFRHCSLWIALTLGVVAGPARAATGWIPPPSLTALLPSAAFAPNSTHAIQLTLRANRAPANLNWVASTGGAFVLGVVPASGSITVPQDSVRQVTLNVTVPTAALGGASVSIEITNQADGSHVAKAATAIFAASGGMPEVWPNPSTFSAPARTSGNVSFQVRSTTGTTEVVDVTSGRDNPDPENGGALFPGSAMPVSADLPGGATITLNAPTTIAGSAYGGNANSVQCSISSAAGITTAVGYALSSAAIPDSLPSALFPIGLTPMVEAATGRDGPVELASRGAWLVPSGLNGVRVLSAGSGLARFGPVDADGSGSDDRLVGQIRIPSYAAAIAVVPGFVGPGGDTLDLGLVAAGRAGLMVLDLRTIFDPLFGTWEDFFDQNLDGVDDRIMKSVPLSGFATDVSWFRSPTGRVVALVAAADTGSVPVAADYDPALVVPSTGSGVVGIDITALVDSLAAPPFLAGSLQTLGSTLDLELRRESAGAVDLAIADGASGVSVYHVTTTSTVPAAITYSLLGSVALSSAWGSPSARDACWISNTRDSVYLAVAASAGGVQILRAPLGGAPTLVLAQQTSAPAIGLAGTWTGTLGVAMGVGGVALMRVPSGSELDKIAPAASPPYTAPVLLSRGQSWTEGRPLELGWQWSWSASSTSMKFLGTAGPIPDLLVSDGPRALLLRPGSAPITAVLDAPSPPHAMPLVVSVAPNPSSDRTEITVFDSPAQATALRVLEIEIYDVQGRCVRQIRRPGTGASLTHFTWDGRDGAGRRLGSGRYWLQVRDGSRSVSHGVLLLR